MDLGFNPESSFNARKRQRSILTVSFSNYEPSIKSLHIGHVKLDHQI